MAIESVSRRQASSTDSVAEDDYRSFCEALNSSARGRAFLEEFTRRNRQADTEVVLSALKRIEETARQHAAASPEADRIRQDLRALLDTLRAARPQSENSPTAIKAATLAALIDFAQARIEALVVTSAAAGEAEALAAVPALEQPELPIPHPAAATSPLMALVQSSLRAEPEASIRPEPAKAGTPQPFVSPQARRKNATVVPIVEFDYRTHQAGRTASLWSAPEDAWTMLAPPTVSSPAFPAPAAPQPVPLIAEPDSAPAPRATPAADVETYELWLDAPVAANAEADAKTDAKAETLAAAVSDVAPVAEPVSNAAPSGLMLPEMVIAEAVLTEKAVAETALVEEAVVETALVETADAETALAEVGRIETADIEAAVLDDGVAGSISGTGMTSAALADAAAAAAAALSHIGDALPTTEAAFSTIETLMQQMESATAPAAAVKGHAETADPLAPIMALSEEERIALFT